MNFGRLLIFATGLALCTQAIADVTTNESFFSRNQKFDNEGVELYTSNLDLKKHKKIGVGISIGGANGALGLNSELNLDPEAAVVVGLGMGPNYGTFSLLYKQNFEGLYLSPYGKIGYSKWFSAANNTTSAGNSDFIKRTFSESEIKNGKFDTDLLITSFGAEYNQLEGELSGVNFYGELVMMTEIKSAKLTPSGAVGIIYFY